MTVKSCCKCKLLGGQNLAKTGRFCHGMPVVGITRVVIKNDAQQTFYCANFQPTEVETLPVQTRRFV